MIILPIKKKWYDLIFSGEKKEEYREIKPYYTSRFNNEVKKNIKIKHGNCKTLDVLFRNGYSNKSPSFTAVCKLRQGTGNPNWGAIKGKQYYILEILAIKKKGATNV